MTTPRVSATMLSARRHVEGRRGMPGMMPRGARGPGARREEGARGASARAGARRARQGGRGGRARAPGAAGRTSCARGMTGTGRRGGPAGPAAAPSRARPWACSGTPSPRRTSGRATSSTRARAGRPGSARGPAGCARARPGSCARGPARPWAAPLRPGGGSRLLPGRRHAPRRVAGRQAARVGGGVAPGAAALGSGQAPDGRPIESERQVLEEVHLQDLLGAQAVLLGDGAHLAAQARIVPDPGRPHITSR